MAIQNLTDIVEDSNPEALVWTIKSPSLEKLDNLRFELNYDLGRLEHLLDNKIPNKVTCEYIKQTVKEIKRRARRVTISSNFEDILREDIMRNAAAAQSIIDFISDFDESLNNTIYARKNKSRKIGHFKVLSYLKEFYGHKIPIQTPYATLVRLTQHLDHRAIDTYSRKVYKILALSQEIYIEGLFSKAKNEILPLTKDVISIFGEFLGLSKEDLNVKVELDITNRKYSYFHSGTFYASIDPNEIYFYREDGEDKEFLGHFLLEAIHEGTHAVHEIISGRTFPNSRALSPMEFAYNEIHMPLTEGIARMNERFWIPFIVEKNKRRFRVNDKDIEAMSFISKFDLARRIPQTLYTVLKVRENNESPSPNSLKELSRIMGLPIFRRDQYFLDDESLHESMYNIGTLLGTDYVKRTMKGLNVEFGYIKVNRNMPIILRGFLSGMWQLPTHYRFLKEEYLPRARRFFK